ncbi:MAG: nucleoside triphosphate pyrophosphohydrolase [Candidatus Krumholzibacteriia bacterium]
MPLPRTEELLETIRRLRAPGGCPWDRRQTLTDAARYLMDEAGELFDAALSGDRAHAAEELADLLYMVCFCREIMGETQPLSFEDVAQLGNEKLVRRHPHVFGEDPAADHHASQERWNAVKAAEKRARGLDTTRESVLKDLSASSSPLAQASEYQENAASVGFTFADAAGAWAQLAAELEELRRAAAAAADAAARDAAGPAPADAVRHEMGDVLFAAVNLARLLGVAPDDALRLANRRFRARFRVVEAQHDWSRERLRAATPAQLLAAWRASRAGDEAPPAR